MSGVDALQSQPTTNVSTTGTGLGRQESREGSFEQLTETTMLSIYPHAVAIHASAPTATAPAADTQPLPTVTQPGPATSQQTA